MYPNPRNPSQVIQMSDSKCLNVRLEGKSDSHIREAAKKMNVCIRQVFKRDGNKGYYGYGNTIEKFNVDTLIIKLVPEPEATDAND